jgi:predicted anti-sigma-YlaC factor YlaD
MNEDPKVRNLDCARAMGFLHQRLDGDRLGAEQDDWLSRHLAGCADCRQADGQLRQIQQALQELSATTFPQDALEEVWDQTTRTQAPRPWFGWRAIAAAAVLALAFVGIWRVGFHMPPEPAVVAVEERPTEAELARAEAEARFVLNLTATALRRTERAAIGEVVGERVTPALKRIPLLMPSGPEESNGTRKNGEDDV